MKKIIVFVLILITLSIFLCTKNRTSESLQIKNTLSVKITDKKCYDGTFVVNYQITNADVKDISGDNYQIVVRINGKNYSTDGEFVSAKSEGYGRMFISDYHDCNSFVSIELYPL